MSEAIKITEFIDEQLLVILDNYPNMTQDQAIRLGEGVRILKIKLIEEGVPNTIKEFEELQMSIKEIIENNL